MTRIAALKTTKEEQVREAKRAFILSLLDLSWRLAAAFMVPLFVGAALGNAVAGTIVGFVIATLFIIKIAIDSGKVNS